MSKQKVNSSLNNQAFIKKLKMCVKTNPKVVKIVVGVVIVILICVISLSLYFGIGQAKSSVVMKGDNKQSKVSQSVGLHLIEVNNSGDTGGCNNWTYAEYSVFLLVFAIILKCSHLGHHCIWTKRQIRNSVAKERSRMQVDLDKLSTNERVIVPAI